MQTKTTGQRFLAFMAVVFAGLVLAACSSQPATPPQPTPPALVVADSPTITPATPPTITPATPPTIAPATPATVSPATATPAPAIEPTPEVGLPITTLFLGAQVPITATGFADIPGNVARGEDAPAFRAELMDRGPVTNVDWQGSYLLLIPSVAGCGECMVNLFELTEVYPDYKDTNLQVAFLSIYPADQPDVWRPLAANFPDLPIQWGTVDPNFVTDYNIQGLGSVLLFDPQGRLVFRSDNALQAAGFKQLLALADQSAHN